MPLFRAGSRIFVSIYEHICVGEFDLKKKKGLHSPLFFGAAVTLKKKHYQIRKAHLLCPNQIHKY